MVAINDLGRVQLLYLETQAINTALGNFAAGGEIISMVVSGAPSSQQLPPFSPQMRSPVSVNTVGVSYPPMMIETIKSALTARQQAIEKELTDLGVDTAPDRR